MRIILEIEVDTGDREDAKTEQAVREELVLDVGLALNDRWSPKDLWIGLTDETGASWRDARQKVYYRTTRAFKLDRDADRRL